MRGSISIASLLIASLALVTTSIVAYADAGPKQRLSAEDSAIVSDVRDYADENCGEWSSHGDVVSCIARSFGDFAGDKSYGNVNKGQIMRIVAHSDLGKGGNTEADDETTDDGTDTQRSVDVVTSVGITSSADSPQKVGASITFTANPLPSGINAEYKWWVLPPGGSWTPLTSGWGGKTYTWNTTGKITGEYQIGVWARAAGSSVEPFETAKQIAYTLEAVTTAVKVTTQEPASTTAHGNRNGSGRSNKDR